MLTLAGCLDSDGDELYDDRYLAVRHELLIEEYGRIRHVAQGPKGAI